MQTSTFTNGMTNIGSSTSRTPRPSLDGHDELIIGWADGGVGDPVPYTVDAHRGLCNDVAEFSRGICTAYGDAGDDAFTVVDAGGLRATLHGVTGPTAALLSVSLTSSPTAMPKTTAFAGVRVAHCSAG